jgi:LysM repeat protein
MERERERWGLSVAVFLAAASVFSFILVKSSRDFVEQAKTNGSGRTERETNGVLYNHHLFRPQIDVIRLEKNPDAGGNGAEEVPEGPKSFIYHKVRSGDSLWKIAKIYGVNIGEILSDNDIGDPDRIYAGSVIRISPKTS